MILSQAIWTVIAENKQDQLQSEALSPSSSTTHDQAQILVS
jgi:hypothetical protein